MTCSLCGRPAKHLDLCETHFSATCTCTEPDADPLGMCRVCKRKPAHLLRRPAVAS